MDNAAEQAKLIEKQAVIQSYLDHPVAKELNADATERKDAMLKVILYNDIDSVESLFAHVLAIGEYRGLVRRETSVSGKLEELEQQIKELN